MRYGENIVRVGSPGSGKTEATVASIAESNDAEVDIDPHEDSLAKKATIHAKGTVLHARLSNLEHTLGFELLKPADDDAENHRRGEAFVDILVRRRNAKGLAGTPLLEEMVFGAINLFLFQRPVKPIDWLPYAFLTTEERFDLLVRDCTLPEVRAMFRHLGKLSYKALRAEAGSAMRLINAVFRSPAFIAWSRGGFDLGAFLEKRGKLIVERGSDLGSDTSRTILAAIILLVIGYAERRKHALPTIRLRIDEATNAGLATETELRAAAEHNKRGLYFEMNLQRLDVPGSVDDFLQLFHRHEWYACQSYELARKAATDIVAGLPRSDEPRAQRVAQITDEIMNFEPGWRWVRDKYGSRKQYVPMLENPWPDWPGLREGKYLEQLCRIHVRPEYRVADAKPSASGSTLETPPPDRSPESGSLAARLKRARNEPTAGSADSGEKNS